MPGALPLSRLLLNLSAVPHADDVEVTGVVIRQFGPMFPGVRCQVNGAAVEGSSLLQSSAVRRASAACLPCWRTTANVHISLLQVGLALQATSLTVANERKAAVEVTPEAAALFSQYWQAHAGCPLEGRNKVGGGMVSGSPFLWAMQVAG